MFGRSSQMPRPRDANEVRSWVEPYLDHEANEGIATAVLGQVRTLVQNGQARTPPSGATMICLTELKLIAASAEAVLPVAWFRVAKSSITSATVRLWWFGPAMDSLDFAEIELDPAALRKQKVFRPVFEKLVEETQTAMTPEQRQQQSDLAAAIQARDDRQLPRDVAEARISEILKRSI